MSARHLTLHIGRLLPGLALLTAIASAQQADAPHPDDAELSARVRPLIERAMARGIVPGLQVAVVLADGRRWSGGFGIADMATGRLVDTDTRFYLASTTKALTALAATKLHFRGEFDLDASLADALPHVRWPQDLAADEITVRDLLTHTHGMIGGPLSYRVAYTGEYTNESFVAGLAEVELRATRDFRYTNFGYDIVGVLLDRARTRGWKEVVEREVLQPLGMTRTTSWQSRIPDDELAMPHEMTAEGLARIPLTKKDDNLGPAGGHFSTAADLGRLLIAEMNAGALDGEQVIPADVITETLREQVPQDREFIHYKRHHWGLGWDIGSYDADTVIHRPGGFAGYYANAAFFPDHGFGVVVLSNGGRGAARLAELVAGAIYDEMIGERQDPIAHMDAGLDELQRMSAQVRDRMSATVLPSMADEPLRDWDDYVGTYVNERWGTIEVLRTTQGLQMKTGPMEADAIPLADEDNAFYTRLFGEDDVATFSFEDTHVARAMAFAGATGEYVRHQ